MLNHKVCEYRREIALLDGSRAVLRPICPGDKKALLEFHGRLSEDTRYLRYQYLKGELTESDLKNYCDVDYVNTFALVAEMQRNGGKEIVGVGRYCRLPDPGSAEVAFVVQDSEQWKGIGTQLLKNLAGLAWQQDIRYFIGEVLRMNGKMITIFRKSDPGLKNLPGNGSTCTVSISLAEAMRRDP